MTKLGMRPFSLAILIAVASSTGCQSTGSSQYAATSSEPAVIRTVKAEREPVAKGSVVVLSQELESPASGTGTTDGSSLWSKLRPTRFLLPRTDADAETETTPEPAQGLDDGF